MFLGLEDGPSEVFDNAEFNLGLGLDDVWMAVLGA